MSRNPRSITIIKSLLAPGTPPHYFGWLPPHGRPMYPGEIIQVQGVIETWLNRITSKTKLNEFIDDVATGKVEVSHELGSTVGQHTPVQDNFELAGITSSEAEAYEDKMLCLSEDTGLYRFDAQSLLAPDNDKVVIPIDIIALQPGRWIKLTGPSDVSTVGVTGVTGVTGPIGPMGVTGATGSGGGGSDFIEDDIETTDSTLTTISTIPILDDTVVTISAWVSARRTDDFDIAGYQRQAVVYRDNGGAATRQGNTHTPLKRETAAQWDVKIEVAGNNALIQVKGAAGHTINWKNKYFTTEVS